jgi:hypothetical protein
MDEPWTTRRACPRCGGELAPTEAGPLCRACASGARPRGRLAGWRVDLPTLAAALCLVTLLLAGGWYVGRRIDQNAAGRDYCIATVASDEGTVCTEWESPAAHLRRIHDGLRTARAGGAPTSATPTVAPTSTSTAS